MNFKADTREVPDNPILALSRAFGWALTVVSPAYLLLILLPAMLVPAGPLRWVYGLPAFGSWFLIFPPLMERALLKRQRLAARSRDRIEGWSAPEGMRATYIGAQMLREQAARSADRRTKLTILALNPIPPGNSIKLFDTVGLQRWKRELDATVVVIRDVAVVIGVPARDAAAIRAQVETIQAVLRSKASWKVAELDNAASLDQTLDSLVSAITGQAPPTTSSRCYLVVGNALTIMSANTGIDAARRCFRLVELRSSTVLGVNRTTVAGNLAKIVRDPGTGQAISQVAGGVKRWLVTDNLGSTIALIDNAAGVARAYSYDVDGNATTNGTGPGTQITYAGGTDIGNGLIHYGARFYSPGQARWTQQDPLDSPGDLDNANRYLYVGSDPVNEVDPTGLIGAPSCGTGTGRNRCNGPDRIKRQPDCGIAAAGLLLIPATGPVDLAAAPVVALASLIGVVGLHRGCRG